MTLAETRITPHRIIDWSVSNDLVVVAFARAVVVAESEGAAVDETISLGVRTRQITLDDLTHRNRPRQEFALSAGFIQL